MPPPAPRLVQPPPQQSQMPVAPGEFLRQPVPRGTSPWRIQGFSRNQKGLGMGGLDEFNALQKRDPMTGKREFNAFYDPYNSSQQMSAPQVAGNAAAQGQQVNSDGTLTDRGVPPSQINPAQPPVPSPTQDYVSRIFGGGFAPQAQQPPPQAQPTRPNPAQTQASLDFQRRLAAARSAVEEGRRMQQMQEQNRFSGTQTEVRPTATTLRTPYGTASISNRPSTGGTTTDATGRTVPLKEFFQSAANRQGVANKFASPPSRDMVKAPAKFLNRIPRAGPQGQMLRS